MAIINNNDMEIILKGSKEEVIRKMLQNRLYCRISLPIKKPDKIISKYSSTVFVSNMNRHCLTRSFAIRTVGTNALYEDCENYLCIYHKRGCNEENKKYFDRATNRIIRHGGKIIYQSIDETISFLKDKELVLITTYMHYGNFEQLKVRDFLEDIILLWKESGSKFIRRDENCDIRIYLRPINDDNCTSDNGLCLEDIRDFDIRKKVVNILKEHSKKYFSDANYYSAEYETQTKNIQAAYFVTRFHSNTQWEADPVCIVTVRLSAFVLPGMVSNIEASVIPQKKKTRKLSSGTDYIIDSIHFNSDIFYDFSEFDSFIDTYMYFFGVD